MRIQPGKIQELTVFDENDRVYLLGADHDFVALQRFEINAKEPLNVGDKVTVFTFYNEHQELEATVQLPELEVGQVGQFKVKNVNQIGAFINIGTRRDILIPFPQQREDLQTGRQALVILQDDPVNKRLFASTKIAAFLKNPMDIPFKRGQEVDLIIAEKIDIGRRVIINGTYMGVLFSQEMTSRVHEGEKIKGYVRKVEGKDIQVSLQKEGMELLEDGKSRVMNYLELNNGYARLNDDSDPEEIKLRLRMSKGTFKKVVGMLYKEGKVLITKFGVKLNKTGEIPTEPPVKHERKSPVAPKKAPTRNGADEAPRQRKYERRDEDASRERKFEKRDGDAPRKYERRDGDAPRERKFEKRDGDAPRERKFEKRDGDAPRKYERRDGDAPRERKFEKRDGDAPRKYERRDGGDSRAPRRELKDVPSTRKPSSAPRRNDDRKSDRGGSGPRRRD